VRLETYGFTATPPPGVRLLFDRQQHPEGCWNWFEVLAETTLSGREGAYIIALVDEGGRAVSAVPVVTVDGYVIRGLASPFTTLFSAPFGTRENARTLGRLLAGKVGGTLRLDALDCEDGASRAFEEGLALGGLVTARFKHFANWFEQIDDFTAYWNGRGSRLKATVKRKAAPLLRAGRLGFAQVDMTAGWQQGAQIYKGIYAKSWKPAEPHPGFIDTLLEKLGPCGIAKLGVVTIDGLPVAAQIWLVQGRHATIFKLAHDPAFDRQSPGTLLTHWILQQLHEIDGVRDVDFGRGDDAYKREWLSLSRDREGFLAANPRTFKGLAALIFDILPSKITRILRPKTGKGNAAITAPIARVEIGGCQA
jgi:Acetyltransferase (GNAT) domain